MLNSNFQKAAEAVKQIQSRGNSLWSHLCLFVVTAGVAPETVKQTFKSQEAIASDAMGLKLNENSTYKVQKGVLIKAVTLGVPVVDGKGKPLGKSAVEAAVKAAGEPKEEKSPLEKFQKAMNDALKAADNLPTEDVLMAYALLQQADMKLKPRLELRLAA